MSQAITTQGTTIEVDIDGTPTWTNISEPSSIGDIANTAPLVDVSHLQSPAKEYIGGLPDGDEIELQCNYVKNDAGQEFLRDNQTTTQPFRVTYSNGDTDEFSGTILRAGKGGLTVDSKVMFSARIKISGGITSTEAP